MQEMVNCSENSRTKHEERLRLSLEKDVKKKKYVKMAVKYVSKKEKRNLPRTSVREQNETIWKNFWLIMRHEASSMTQNKTPSPMEKSSLQEQKKYECEY